MCLSYITKPRAITERLYSQFEVLPNGQVQRWIRKGMLFNVDSDGWEYATRTRINRHFQPYYSGFHMYESLDDATRFLKKNNHPNYGIVVSFEWQGIEVQGIDGTRCITVVHARKASEIVWDGRLNKEVS